MHVFVISASFLSLLDRFSSILDRAESHLDSQNTVFAALRHFCKKNRRFRSRTPFRSDFWRFCLRFRPPKSSKTLPKTTPGHFGDRFGSPDRRKSTPDRAEITRKGVFDPPRSTKVNRRSSERALFDGFWSILDRAESHLDSQNTVFAQRQHVRLQNRSRSIQIDPDPPRSTQIDPS